jgi:DNA excision repair protein ERCC-5
MAAQEKLEEEQRERDLQVARREAERDQFQFESREKIRKQDIKEVVDLEAGPNLSQEVIAIDSESEFEDEAMFGTATARKSPTPKMCDLADRVRSEPPVADAARLVGLHPVEPMVVAEDNHVEEGVKDRTREPSVEHQFVWEDSDHDDERARTPRSPAEGPQEAKPLTQTIESDEEDFEDIMLEAPAAPVPEAPRIAQPILPQSSAPIPPTSGAAHQTVDVEIDDVEVEEQYSDPEDEELMLQLAQEEEEHARFASTLNNRTMQQNIADYEQELKQLRNQQKKDRRDADEVTQTMITECQQLLALFGLPYITAPMEAEAQCAELVKLGLVDGIVTDDSDVFLFGGTRIYKNVFNQAKFVECYLTSDLESEFGLTRQRLISIAQLLGSDYTEGLIGIGPVTALEILSEFDDLASFKVWWTAVQQGQRAKDADASNAFRKKFRRNTTKVFLPTTFPDPRVESAYLQPEVDSDPSEFIWGVPDLHALRTFLMSTVGWTNERVDEILVPVIKDMNTRQQEGTQANITAFFGGGVGAGAFASRRRAEVTSKRLESALHRIGDRARGNTRPEGGEQIADDTASPAKSTPQKKGKRSKRTAATVAEDSSTAGDESEEFFEPRKKARKGTKSRRKPVIDIDG